MSTPSSTTVSAKQKQAEGNIQTFLRIRPSKNPSGYFGPDDLEKDSMNFTLPDNYHSDFINNTKLRYSFHFNGILDMKASQEEVFNRVGAAAVTNVIDGFNSTVFAYGQTGSGKTFTLMGGPEKYSDRGIIPRSLSLLFGEFRKRTDMQFKMYISYLELYNEQGYDLLDSSQNSKALEDMPKVTILEDEHGNYHLKNLSMHPAESEEDALDLLFRGDTNRAVAETPMNMASSRSHCIFSISLESRSVGSDKIRRSKLHLVDLAGSERVGKTNSSGSVLTEAKYINSSLFFLEMVIVALYEKATKGRTHIPYRNSMMTSVLRDSLGGNCKTIMIATLNPEAAHTEESLSTCRFAQRVSLIKNRATINEEMDPSQVIRRLKTEILNLREEAAFLKGESGEGDALSSEEVDELQTQCRQYCDDPDHEATLSLGAMTLTRIKTAFRFMKQLVYDARSNAPSSSSSAMALTAPSESKQDEQMVQQIRDLKSLLAQRDNEINILVNMVKQGKTMETRESESTRSAAAQAKVVSSVDRSQDKSHSEKQVPGGANDRRNRNELIIKRHLFGIPPPSDPKVFDDAAASFEWFRERSELNTSINENKDVLKSKIAEAKTLGERANQSRNTITYLKNTIESIRKERALEQLSTRDEQTPEAESAEEITYRRAIEQEKIVYKESFDKLKVLKPEIEHIRKILERCRTNLQTQFDQWFSALHSRGAAPVLQFEEKTAESTPISEPSAKKSSVPSVRESKQTDEVDDDIMAFYQAKEELLKRKS